MIHDAPPAFPLPGTRAVGPDGSVGKVSMIVG